MTRATIDDVARASGTSKKTVSRVLNNEPNVRDSVRVRVLAAMAELNYRPLTSARSLATNRSFMIGLLYDNLSPSYIMEVQAGVLEVFDHQEINQPAAMKRQRTIGGGPQKLGGEPYEPLAVGRAADFTLLV